MDSGRKTGTRIAGSTRAYRAITVNSQPSDPLEGGPDNQPDDLLTTAEVALIVRPPVSTVRYWRYIGTGPNCFKLGRRVVCWRADVNAWLAEQEAAGSGRAAS